MAMDYVISFLEGIITFVSPCMLPMLPIYITYFAGGAEDKKKALINAVGFVIGFTVLFVSLGAFAGTFGRLLINYSRLINVVGGIIILFFGLNYIGLVEISFLNKSRKINHEAGSLGFLSAMLLGIIFSIGWTPCVGTFLGSALMLAATSYNSFKGILMLLAFSLGLGIPFVISSILLDRLKSVFDFIKRNYTMVNLISGVLLIIIGLLMIKSWFGILISLLLIGLLVYLKLRRARNE
jgi:cytochrome c-type biogenesis protein